MNDGNENNKKVHLASGQPVHILLTEADIIGSDISKMSDFFGLYSKKTIESLSNGTTTTILREMPWSDIGMINELIQQASVIFKGDLTLIPDFDSLPQEIKHKLKTGEYSIGESRQVDGNLRAVIVDGNKKRIRDITLKQVINQSNTFDAARGLLDQLQMKQIIEQLTSIQELQEYQLDCDRNKLLKPFFNARDFISQAQNADSMEERICFLNDAAKQLTFALNAVSTDIKTTSRYFCKYTKHAFFHKQSSIDKMMIFLTEDLLLLTKCAGIQMLVLDYLGKEQDARQVFNRFERIMLDFASVNAPNHDITMAELLHNYYHYTEENRDCWYNFSTSIRASLSLKRELPNSQQIYIVSTEECKNE